MKQLIMVLCTVSTLLMAQDAVGNYKLSGLDVQYYSAARYDTPIMVSDIYGAGVTLPILSIGAGEIFYPYRNGPLTEAQLAGIGVNLNVNLNDDGTGQIAPGSFYPDVNVDPDVCVSDLQVLPIDDPLIYESNANLNLTKYGVNVAGLPNSAATNQGLFDLMGSAAQYHGTTGYGGLGLSQSVVFDYFTMIPSQPSICDGAGNCFDLVYPDGSVLPGGAPVPGLQVGFWKKGTIHGDLGASFLTQSYGIANTAPDFYLEWHAIDGAAAESGLGDFIGEDEDGDGTDFDRIFGLPYITATFINPALGYSYPIFGDLTGSPLNDYITSVGTANDGYVMDPSGALAQWGNFLTWHGVVAQQLIPQCYAAGGLEAFGTGFCIGQATGDDFAAACDYAGVYAATYGLCMQAAGPGWESTCNDLASATESYTGGECSNMAAVAPSVCGMAGAALAAGYGSCEGYVLADHMYGADDSGADGDPTCLADGDPLDCSGRIPMHYSPTCIPQIEMREVCAEFIEITDECNSGDTNGDGTLNVLDVVTLVGMILDGVETCQSDVNMDGNTNVLDVVDLVNTVLGGGARAQNDNATSIEINMIGNEVTMTANGYVGAVQMTLSHGDNFQINLTDDALVADYVTTGNSTTLMVVVPEGNNLFTANGEFTIESVVAASTSDSYLNATVNMPKDYTIGAAYPNPFNPTTEMSLTLNDNADVSVKVFNMTGQLVDVIANGQMDQGSYSFTWDGTNSSSGVYFIQTEVGTEINSQKIMLIK